MAFKNSTRFIFGLVTLLLLFIEFSSSSTIYASPLSKHSFTEVSKCEGVYDKNIYSIMNDICDQCYDKYRDPGVFRGCRKDCFTTDYFAACLQVLGITEAKERLAKGISVLNGQLE